MTSQELMNKYGDALFRDSENGKVMTLKIIIGVLCKDILDTAKERGIRTEEGLKKVISEKNECWNAFARQFRKKYPKAKFAPQANALKTALEGAIDHQESNH